MTPETIQAKNLRARLFARALPDQTGCLVWIGPVDHGGYGEIYGLGRKWRAHRAAWTLQRGPIPEGLTIDHLCRNTRRLNVEHMELVPPGENVRRSWDYSTRHRFQPECIRGHPLSGDNLLTYTVSKTGRSKRSCRKCRAIRRAKAKAARRLAA